MIQYLTTFSTEADYNEFLGSEDCPYVNVSHITGTNENKYYKNSAAPIQPFTITITEGEGTDYALFCFIRKANQNKNVIVYVKVNNGDWNMIHNGDQSGIDLARGLKKDDVVQIKCDNCKTFTDFAINNGDDDVRLKVSGNFNSLFTSENYQYYVIPDFREDWSYCHNLLCGTNGHVSDAENLWLPTNCLPRAVFKELFKDNTYLTKAPDIDALYLPKEACRAMFWGCTSLVNMPNIAAKSIDSYGTFKDMFNGGCTALSNATTLHIENIYVSTSSEDNGAFDGMFYGCTSLVTAPAWTTGYEVYLSKNGSDSNEMLHTFRCTFRDCTSLTTCNWNLRIKTTHGVNHDWDSNILWDNIIEMFYGCTSLVTPFSITVGPEFMEYDPYASPFYLNISNVFNGCQYITELIFSKVKGRIGCDEGAPSGTGTIYVADDSIYLDPNSEFYGQTPIPGWTVESINNYPNS